MIGSPPISDEVLREAISAAEARVAEQGDNMRVAEESLRAVERELALLVELARLRGLVSLPLSNGASAADAVEGRSADLPRVSYESSPRSSMPKRDALVRAVIDVLRAHGKPMPIRELMAEVISRDARIPGRGEQANLISVITRVPEITRPQRGVYGLSEWGTARATPKGKMKRATSPRRKSA
jgi:hypothetical protein